MLISGITGLLPLEDDSSTVILRGENTPSKHLNILDIKNIQNNITRQNVTKTLVQIPQEIYASPVVFKKKKKKTVSTMLVLMYNQSIHLFTKI